ncbi:MAG: sensor histidine kinase [Lachnospiraceae bacterium]|nr:sensor histidine kinase [Lachnospiraceae bacterium]
MSDKNVFHIFSLYIKKNIKLLLFYIFEFCFFCFILAMDGIDIKSVLYAVVLVSFIGLIAAWNGFISFKNKVQCLRRDNVPQKRNSLEEEYARLIDKLEEEIFLINNDNEKRKQEMLDFYTMWVHQIKTPIAAMNLICQDEDIAAKKVMSELEGEVFKIEQYVEMVLSYLRMESDTTDYVIRNYHLEDMIKQAVRKHAKSFIKKKIRIELKNLDREIITDEKWFSFALEQLLTNALKYTNKGKISIYVNSQEELVIEDTGIGIDQSDLPRIFEKGFTGYNGRTNRKSTGLGLYLCKTVLKNIGMGIRAESERNRGTKMIIDIKHTDMVIE